MQITTKTSYDKTNTRFRENFAILYIKKKILEHVPLDGKMFGKGHF